MREDSSLTEKKDSFLAVNQHLRSKKTEIMLGEKSYVPQRAL